MPSWFLRFRPDSRKHLPAAKGSRAKETLYVEFDCRPGTTSFAHKLMERIDYLGAEIGCWKVGNSTFLAWPENGARLMNWHLELADGSFRIPMSGFVESFNVSVAAAITIAALRKEGKGDLPPRELAVLRARYYLRAVRAGYDIVVLETQKGRKQTV